MESLSIIKSNTSVKIIKVLGEKSKKKRLLEMGLLPETIVVVDRIAPLGDPIEISVRGSKLSIRKEDAKNILVEIIA